MAIAFYSVEADLKKTLVSVDLSETLWSLVWVKLQIHRLLHFQ